MDADLERFLTEIRKNTEELKKVNKDQARIADALEVLVKGDPRMKIPPLNINLSRIAYGLEHSNQVMAAILAVLKTVRGGVGVADLIKKFLK